MIPQDRYNTHLEDMPIVCVDICILYQDKILLVRRKTEPKAGKLWLPGGRLYKNETLSECALRKSKEEVGLYCKIIKQLSTRETIFKTGPSGIPIHSINIGFLLQPIREVKIVLDNYSSEYVWVQTIPKEVTEDYIIDSVLEALPHFSKEN